MNKFKHLIVCILVDGLHQAERPFHLKVYYRGPGYWERAVDAEPISSNLKNIQFLIIQLLI